MEEWFQRVPAEVQRDLLPRLTSKDDSQHQDALFELYLHELLLRMGYTVEHHLTVSGQGHRPDFLALRDGVPRFYLEATSAHEPKARMKEARRHDAVIDALNGVECLNFWLSVRIDGDLRRVPPLRSLCRKVEAWVSSLNPDRVSAQVRVGGEELRRTWEFDEWALALTAIPRPEHLRGDPTFQPVGSESGRMDWIVGEAGILESVREKAHGWKVEPDLPLVLAVNMLDGCRRGVDMWKGLNRAWALDSEPRDRHVSAALMCWMPVAIAAPHETPELIHHPRAARPLPKNWWSLPQRELTAEGMAATLNAECSAPTLLGLTPVTSDS